MTDIEERPPAPKHHGRAELMFLLSSLCLLALGAIVHRHKDPDWENLEFRIELCVILATAPLIILDTLVLFIQRLGTGSFWALLAKTLMIILCPPLRMGARDPKTGHYLWLPGTGWRYADKQLRKDLEHFFGVPMIIMALLILPILGLEYGWTDLVREHPILEHSLHIANTLIWFAFAMELFVMTSAAENKLRYLVSQWINVIIVVLPMFEFLPILRALRIGRALRLSQLSKMGRVYRLRGLAMRAWRAVLILKVLQKLFGGSLEKRLEDLEELEAAKLEELEELREEIAEVRELITQREAGEQAESVSDLFQSHEKEPVSSSSRSQSE